MSNQRNKFEYKSLSTYLLYLTPIVMLPNLRDPFNLPKFIWLSLFAVTSSILLAFKIKELNKIPSIRAIIPLYLFLSAWILSTLSNLQSGIGPMLLGEYGRLAGVLPVAALIFAISIHDLRIGTYNRKAILIALVICGNIYAFWTIFLKVFGKNVEKDSLYQGQIQGLGGNINFTGSLLSISIISSLLLLISSIQNITYKKQLLSFSIVIQIISLILSPSFLALVSIMIGIFLVTTFAISKKKIKGFKLFRLLRFLILAGFLVSFLVFLSVNREEISTSFAPRIKFWKITNLVFMNHPITGIGPDRLNDYYIETGIKYEILNDNFASTIDSAHNFFLDIAAMSGFVGLITVLFFLIRSVLSFYKELNKYGIDSYTEEISIFIVWLVVLIQSLVIPFTIWHILILFGLPLVFGRVRNANKVVSKEGKSLNDKKNTSGVTNLSKYKFYAVLGHLFLIFSLGFSAIVVTINDLDFRTALASGNLSKLEGVMNIRPTFDEYFEISIEAMNFSMLPEAEVQFARELVRFNPLNSIGWNSILNSPQSSNIEKEKARIYLKNRILKPSE